PYAWNIKEAKKRGYTAKLPVYGPLAWSVPGCVSGWDALHTFFGKTKFADLMAPAAHYADEGFVLTEIIAQNFAQANKTFAKYPNAYNTFTQNGKTARFGQLFRNPDIAAFFKILMRDGAQAFYKGEIADRIVKFAQERDGLFTRKDFTEHNPTWVDPVGTSYRGYAVWELPPNGQGIAALQMMNILEQFDIPSLQPNSTEHIHLFLEAKKLAFEDRATYYGDPDKAEVPLDWLISKEYGKERANQINPKQAMKNVRPGVWDGSQDTVYLCASDAQGNMVSLIQSIYYGWGSREVPTGLGFCLQNRGHSFNLNPKHPNSLQPHKRPFHTIIPGFLTQNGTPKCAFGVMGGDFQPQGHAQVLMNMIDFNLSMQQAGEQPRARHFGSSSPNGDVMENGGSFGLEKGFDFSVPKKLQEMGHEPREVNQGRHGGYQAIWREDNPRRYFAGSDPRKDGGAIGY
ncbi:gamma-glutamyltransferase, partial [bacterium]|nr:gamma-glutamyltransferase [bacterium]